MFVLYLIIAIGVIAFVGGGLWVLKVAFGVSTGWGLTCLFFPPIFFARYWNQCRLPFFINITGILVFLIGMMGYAGYTENAKVKELESQIETMDAQAGSEPGESSDVRKIYESKLKNLETLLEKEKQSSAATKAELKEVKARNKNLQVDVAKLSKETKRLSKQGDGPENLKKEIKRLQEHNQALNREMDQLESADQSSMLSSTVKWFLAGGGVLLLGLILGRSVPRKNHYGY